jgi:hypothetical protein
LEALAFGVGVHPAFDLVWLFFCQFCFVFRFAIIFVRALAAAAKVIP